MLLSTLPQEAVARGAWPDWRDPLRQAQAPRLRLAGWICTILLLETAGVAAGAAGMSAQAWPYLPAGLQDSACLAGAAAIWLLAAHSQHLYDPARLLHGRSMLPRTVTALAIGFAIIAVILLRPAAAVPPPLRQAGTVLLAATYVLAVRAVWSARLGAALRGGRHVERALVVAETPFAARRAAAQIERSTSCGLRLVASTALDPDRDADEEAGRFGAARATCSIRSIEAAVRANRFDRVLIVASDLESAAACGIGLCEATSELVARLAQLAVNVTLVRGASPWALGPHAGSRLGRLGGIDILSRPLPPVQSALKRAADLVLASLFLLAASPVMLVAAVLIKLESPGPVLFSQQRIGFHNRVFRIWKFRTMHAHQEAEGGLVQAVRHDARVTRVGRLLRRASLDELPQFFNVLCGDMSVVGPRPHALGMRVAGRRMDDLIATYSARHRTRPGITGWAQVNGCRGDVGTQEKLSRRLTLDCFYIANWSPTLDLYIIVRTAAMLLFDTQAY